jgi:hypothetical protein
MEDVPKSPVTCFTIPLVLLLVESSVREDEST